MRKNVLWRLTPTPAEEHYIRNAAQREGRPLAGMIYKLISEAILARQAAEHQTNRLVSLLKGELDAAA